MTTLAHQISDRGYQIALVGLAMMIGIAAGVDPKIGVALAIGFVFVMIVVSDLPVGLCAFTVVAFLDVLPALGAAVFSFAKLAGLLLAGAWIATATTRRGVRTPLSTAHPWLTGAIIGFVAWCAISLLWSELPDEGTTPITRWALNLIVVPIVFVAITERKHIMWVVWAFVGGAGISALYEILNAPSGGSGDEVARLGSTIGEPNAFAAVLVAGFMLSVALVAATKAPPARLTAGFCGFLCAAGVILSLSRGGLIAMAVALLAAVVFGGRWRALAAVVLVVTAFGTVGYFAYIAPAAQRERITMTNDSGAGREDIWTIGWRMVEDDPVKGIGIGQFQTSAVHYLLEPGAIQRADLIVDKPKVAHNTYLQVLSELGIIGLLLFLGVIGTCMLAALRAAWNFRDLGEAGYELISRALLVGLLGYGAANFFISNQWSKQYWILLAICPALYAVSKRSVQDERNDETAEDKRSGKSLPTLPATRRPRVTAPARS